MQTENKPTLPALIARLLEEAAYAEDRAKAAIAKQERSLARTEQGRAQAYYHAARLAGWREIAE